MNNLSEKEQKRRNLIEKIQAFHKAGISVQEISQITGKDRKTVKKYLEGDPNKLCHSNVHGSLEKYTDFIIKSIQSGLTQSAIARKLADLGYAEAAQCDPYHTAATSQEVRKIIL